METTRLTTTELGSTGLQVTRVGFGAWAIGGGGWQFGWGPRTTMSRSPRSTARSSSASTGSTPRPSTASDTPRRSSAARSRASTTDRTCSPSASLLDGGGGRVVHSLKRDSILREAEASLERLGVDAIDLYQIHWPIPDEDIEEGWAAMAELKEEGLVRHIGVSNFNVAQMRRTGRSRRSRRCSPSTR